MWWQWLPLHIQRNGFYMSDMSDAHISSCLNYLSRELDPLLTRLVVEKGLMSQSQVKEYGWTAILWYLDDQRNRNVELSRYNPRDIQVQLRMLTEPVGTAERKHPFEPDSSRTVSTYAQDLRIFRNKKMHYMEMDRNDAVRIYDSAARLFEALGAPEQKAWCESQLNRVHTELFGAGEAAPVRRELDEEVRQATSAARSSKAEVSAPRGAFTRVRHRFRNLPSLRLLLRFLSRLLLRLLRCVLRWGRAVTRLSRGSRCRWVTAIFLIRYAVSVLRIRCLLLLSRLCLLKARSRRIVWRLWLRSALA